MNERQRLFLVQAKSDYAMFMWLQEQEQPVCHVLHYLQMCTEKLAKAYFWCTANPGVGHAFFLRFLRAVVADEQVRRACQFVSRTIWKKAVRSLLPIVYEIERLAPALAGDGPNPEYPWPRAWPTNAPVEHTFPVWGELSNTAHGRHLAELLARLFAVAPSHF